MRKSSKIVITAAVVVGLFGSGGAALAYWSLAVPAVSGTGTASVVTTITASTANITVNQAALTGMTPGSAAQNLSGTFTSTATVAETVYGMTASILSVEKPVGTPAPGCTSADFALTQATLPGAGITVPAGSSNVAWNPNGTSATIQMINSSSDQSGCVGATVNINYTLQ